MVPCGPPRGNPSFLLRHNDRPTVSTRHIPTGSLQGRDTSFREASFGGTKNTFYRHIPDRMFRDTLIRDRDTLIRDTLYRNTYSAFLVVNFLAEVGGYLGLFLGYSFLHISQGFSFFYNAARCGHIKGSLTQDFRLQVFFMNQCPPGPQVFRWGRFEFFRKFAEIFANEYLSPVLNCSAVSTTPAKNLSPVSTTPVINPCHGEIIKKPKIFRWCQRHRRKTVHRCQRYRRLII